MNRSLQDTTTGSWWWNPLIDDVSAQMKCATRLYVRPEIQLGAPVTPVTRNRQLWRLYDANADIYQQMNPFADSIGRRLVEYANPCPGTRLLDIGTGRGAVARAARDHGCTVVAVDAAPRMVELLAVDLPEITVKQMDATDLTFPTGSFDMVTAGYLIDVLDDPAVGVAEISRVLKRGGVVALSEPCPVPERSKWLHQLATEFWSRPTFEQAAELQQAALQNVRDLLSEAGFVGMTQEQWGQPLRFSTPTELWNYLMNHGTGRAVRSLPEQRATEYHNRFLAEAYRVHAQDSLILDRSSVLFRAHT
jgi:ubiquinone/menaquinone biosynthesis C-methylase UbiE